MDFTTAEKAIDNLWGFIAAAKQTKDPEIRCDVCASLADGYYSLLDAIQEDMDIIDLEANLNSFISAVVDNIEDPDADDVLKEELGLVADELDAIEHYVQMAKYSLLFR